VVESDRSKGDDPDEATSDVSIAVLDVNDTRPSDLRRGRRLLRGAPSDTRNATGAGDALSQRTRRRDRVELGAECIHAQPAAAAKPARQLPRDMQRWGVPPTTVSFCELGTLRRNSELSACKRRAARAAWWLSGGSRRALARAAHQGGQAVWLVCSARRRRPSATRLTPTPSDAYPTLAP
jgi:hypothetical protein